MQLGKLKDNPPVDGFTYSMFTLLLPTVYRGMVQVQMEPLRRTTRYQFKAYTAPNGKFLPIAAFSQIEERISVLAGTYVWGLSLAFTLDEQVEEQPMFVQLSDACTETYFFCDYVRGRNLLSSGNRGPLLLSQPRIISDPGQITVEVYNSNPEAVSIQLAIFCAEPCPRNPDWSNPNNLALGPHRGA